MFCACLLNSEPLTFEIICDEVFASHPEKRFAVLLIESESFSPVSVTAILLNSHRQSVITFVLYNFSVTWHARFNKSVRDAHYSSFNFVLVPCTHSIRLFVSGSLTRHLKGMSSSAALKLSGMSIDGYAGGCTGASSFFSFGIL